jgi:hypothetical protein
VHTDRLRRAVASAPLTFGWLAVLFVTTRVQRSAGRRESLRLQRTYSTNLTRLRREPHRVLAASLFWLDDRRWWPYLPLFVGVLAPAERRLQWWRWLFVGLAAHVIATYLGQGQLRRAIRSGRAPLRLVNARDVGVSYFFFGVAGTLTGYVPREFRTPAQVLSVTALAVNAAFRPTFTEIGHLTALIVGLGAVPLAPDRDRFPYPAVPPRRT